jgi:hypothetical protein
MSARRMGRVAPVLIRLEQQENLGCWLCPRRRSARADDNALVATAQEFAAFAPVLPAWDPGQDTAAVSQRTLGASQTTGASWLTPIKLSV